MMQVKLNQIAKRAKQDKKLKFTSLIHHVNKANLAECSVLILALIVNVSLKSRMRENFTYGSNWGVAWVTGYSTKQEEMSFAIAKIAFEVAQSKKGQIEEYSKRSMDEHSAIGWFQSVIDKTKTKLGNVELYDTPAAKLAFQDTVLLVLYLQQNYQAIEQSAESLVSQLVRIVQAAPVLAMIDEIKSELETAVNLEKALDELKQQDDSSPATEQTEESRGEQEVARPTNFETKEPPTEMKVPAKAPLEEKEPAKGQQKNCTVMKVEIIYDNPVLKYTVLLQQLLQTYGSHTIDKLIEFGQGFKTADEIALLDEILSGEEAFKDTLFLLGLDNECSLPEM